LKYFIDFDGTLVNTVKAIVDLYNQDFKYYSNFHFVNWKSINTWDFDECNCATRDYINHYFNQQRFFDKIEFMPNAYDVLLDLEMKGNEINIVSMGYSPNLKAKKIWIERNLSFANFIGVNFKQYSDKAHIDMSNGILLDDSIKNLETSNARYKILYGESKSWNYGWNGKNILDWKELKNGIRNL
jgi:5'' nucleotidase, deoxy (Pyrimidine), cytosolic type C protein (NT5C).